MPEIIKFVANENSNISIKHYGSGQGKHKIEHSLGLHGSFMHVRHPFPLPVMKWVTNKDVM